jgi:hypothetical protein
MNKNRIEGIAEQGERPMFSVGDAMLASLGKRTVPLNNWPLRAPQKGRGIVIAGYPTVERVVHCNRVNFNLFTALVVARRVTDRRITWSVAPDTIFDDARLPQLPPNYGIDGISGRPLTLCSRGSGPSPPSRSAVSLRSIPTTRKTSLPLSASSQAAGASSHHAAGSSGRRYSKPPMGDLLDQLPLAADALNLQEHLQL